MDDDRSLLSFYNQEAKHFGSSESCYHCERRIAQNWMLAQPTLVTKSKLVDQIYAPARISLVALRARC